MRRFVAHAVMAASCFLASTTAMATNAKFTIFEGKTVVASYVQSLTPVPTFWAIGKGVTVGITQATGLLFGDTFLNYFNAGFAPQVIGTAPEVLGGFYDEKSFDVGFLQLYTQSENHPVFTSGFYTGGTDEFNGSPVTVVIGQPIAVATASRFTGFGFAAVVPEPATWAMMLIGMGAIGLGMRRRAKVEVSYS